MKKTGQDIEAICRKCGDVWHVIVAMTGNSIAKVQCKECGGQHRYKSSDGPDTPATRRRRTATRTSGKRVVSAEPTPLIPFDSAKPYIPYAMTESFSVGDQIAHPTFGQGIVETKTGRAKIQVFFPGGRKILAHRDES